MVNSVKNLTCYIQRLILLFDYKGVYVITSTLRTILVIYHISRINLRIEVIAYKSVLLTRYRLIDQIGTVFANGPGRPGFNLKSCHTKDFKNGT